MKPIGTSLDAVGWQEKTISYQGSGKQGFLFPCSFPLLEEAPLTFSENLACLLLRDSLDLLKHPSRRVGDRLYRVVPALHDQLNISFGQTTNALYWYQSHPLARILSQIDDSVKTYLQSGQGCRCAWARPAVLVGIGALVIIILSLCHCSGQVLLAFWLGGEQKSPSMFGNEKSLLSGNELLFN